MKAVHIFGIRTRVKVSSIRNELNVEIKVVLKCHYTESYDYAKKAGKIVSRSFPERIKSNMQHGTGVKVLVMTLNTERMMSVQRVHDLLSAALGLPVCAGTVCAMVKEMAFQVGRTVRYRPCTHGKADQADNFAAIMSFIGSVKKHGINVFSAVKKTFTSFQIFQRGFQ